MYSLRLRDRARGECTIMTCLGCGCATLALLVLGLVAYIYYDDVALWVSEEVQEQVLFEPPEALAAADKMVPGAGASDGLVGVTGWHLGEAVRVVVLGRTDASGNKWLYYVGLADATEDVIPREKLKQQIRESRAGSLREGVGEKLDMVVQGHPRRVFRQVSTAEDGLTWISYALDLEGVEHRPVYCVVFGPEESFDEAGARQYLEGLKPPPDPRPPATEVKESYTVDGVSPGMTGKQVVELLGPPLQEKQIPAAEGARKKLFYSHPVKIQVTLDQEGRVEVIQGTRLSLDGKPRIQVGQPEGDALGRLGESVHRATLVTPDDTRIYRGPQGYYSLTTAGGKVEGVGWHREDFR